MKAAPTLREQQAELTRELILGAVVEHLRADDPAEISVAEVARSAGVSLRTVYRYFPSRDDLLAAAADWIGERMLGGVPFEETLEDLCELMPRACARFDREPRLVRAMALSQAGRAVRSHRRTRRLEAIRGALREVTDRLPEREARRAEAVVFYLDNMLAWVTMRDEAGLDGREAGEAIRWAMRTLIDDLRRRNTASATKRGA